jgi:hypothetical protein
MAYISRVGTSEVQHQYGLKDFACIYMLQHKPSATARCAQLSDNLVTSDLQRHMQSITSRMTDPFVILFRGPAACRGNFPTLPAHNKCANPSLVPVLLLGIDCAEQDIFGHNRGLPRLRLISFNHQRHDMNRQQTSS